MLEIEKDIQKGLEDLRQKSFLRDSGTGLEKGEVDFISNDYLGLSRHTPHIKHTMSVWEQAYGIGSAASPLVSGRTEGMIKLEKRLAAMKDKEDARIFSSGWQAISSLIPLFKNLPTDKAITIIADKASHNSFYVSCQIAQIRPLRFRHNDIAHLHQLLEKTKDTHQIIFTESVFSMDGDRAPLDAIAQLAKDYQAYLCVDDAHSTGILGKAGRGLAGDYADVIIGTFGKALGSMGAFIAGSHLFCRYLENKASGYIYSTALSPVMLGAVSGALDLIGKMTPQREYVASLAQQFRKKMHKHGFDTGRSTTHIVPVILGQNARTVIHAGCYLRQKGFRVGAIRPPSVPASACRLRVTFHAHNTQQQLSQLVHHITQRKWEEM